jgi:putative Mg2+ transporter-C (MgtC) family protein
MLSALHALPGAVIDAPTQVTALMGRLPVAADNDGFDVTTFGLDTDALVRLVVAGVLGAAVGAEREAGDQPAGLRTHIAVAVGAALFGVVSTIGFAEFDVTRASSNINVDVTRVASNVAVGIGFLGAGVIFRRGNSIRNLTTAASLWTVAAIGLACGTGDVTTAAIATAILLLSLALLRPLRDWIRRRFTTASSPVRVRLVPGAHAEAVLTPDLVAGVTLEEVTVEKEDGRLVVVATLSAHPEQVRRWISTVAGSDDVEAVLQA